MSKSRGEIAAVVQTALDLAQERAEAQALLGKIGDGEAFVGTAQRALHEWRCQLGDVLRRVRKGIPASGPKAKAWGEFVAGLGISADSASNYMKLAEHRDRYPIEASTMSTTEAYRALGLKKPAAEIPRTGSEDLSAEQPLLTAKEEPAAPRRKPGQRQVIDPDSPVGQMLANKPMADPDPPARTADPGATTITAEEERHGEEALPAVPEDARAAERPGDRAEAGGVAPAPEGVPDHAAAPCVHEAMAEDEPDRALMAALARAERAETRVRELEARILVLEAEIKDLSAEVVCVPELVVERDPDTGPADDESQERRPAKAKKAPVPRRTWTVGAEVVAPLKKGPRRAVVIRDAGAGKYYVVLRPEGKRKGEVSVKDWPGGALEPDPKADGAGIAEALVVLRACATPPESMIAGLESAAAAR